MVLFVGVIKFFLFGLMVIFWLISFCEKILLGILVNDKIFLVIGVIKFLVIIVVVVLLVLFVELIFLLFF